MRQPVVSIIKCGNPHDRTEVRETVFKALQLIGGLQVVVSAQDVVLIKPNLVVNRSYTSGVTTSPYVIAALIEALADAGVRKVVVAEGSQVGADTSPAFDETGMREIAESPGAEVINLKRDTREIVVLPGSSILRKLRIPKTVLEADVMISVPVMKTHNDFAASLGLKNTKELV